MRPARACAAGAAGAGLFSAYLFVPHVAGRIKRFMNPASGDTFQVDTAMEAFFNGGWFGLGPGELAVRFGDAAIGGAAVVAGDLIGPGQFGQPGLQGGVGLRGAIGPGRNLFQIALQPGQAVQLLQAQRCGCRGILGPRAKTVPPPKIAVPADQALPRQQGGLQCRAVAPVDQTDLPQPPRQLLKNN